MTDKLISPSIKGTFLGHNGALLSMAFSPNLKQIATSSTDKSIIMWNFRPSVRSYTLGCHEEPVLDLSFSSSGDILASASLDRTVKLWEPKM